MSNNASQTTPNAAEVEAIGQHYCVQRDPRRVARAVGDVSQELARRLCEGSRLNGGSLECQATVYLVDDIPNLTRQDLVDAAAGFIEKVAPWDFSHAE